MDSTPGRNSSGNICPQSNSSIAAGVSMAAQLRPMSPRPPRKVTRTVSAKIQFGA